MIPFRLLIAVLFLTAGIGWSPGQLEASEEVEPQGNVREVRLPRFSAHVFTTSHPVKRVSVTEPEIADVKVITPFDVALEGRQAGSTTCVVWYQTGETEVFQIKVNHGFEVEILLGTEFSPEKSLRGW